MKTSIWEKARKILDKNQIELVGVGEKRLFYRVTEVGLEVRVSPSGFNFVVAKPLQSLCFV